MSKLSKVLKSFRKKILGEPPNPEGFCFPSGLIPPGNEVVQKNWVHLTRGYDDEEFIKECVRQVQPYTMVFYDGLATLMQQVRYVERAGLTGCLVETGCNAGGSAAIMAIAQLKWGEKRRHIHLFDSFEGLPCPIEDEFRDWMPEQWGITKEQCTGQLSAAGSMAVSQQVAEKAIYEVARYPREKVSFHKGWFQDTVPAVAKDLGPIAILRLDGDLYDSTMVVLRNLYSQVVPGGVIIIDDWCLPGCRQACEEFFAEIGIQPYVHRCDATTHYIIKPSGDVDRIAA